MAGITLDDASGFRHCPHRNDLVFILEGSGLLAAAVTVLREATEPLKTKQMVDATAAKGHWISPEGKMPLATLHSTKGINVLNAITFCRDDRVSIMGLAKRPRIT